MASAATKYSTRTPSQPSTRQSSTQTSSEIGSAAGSAADAERGDERQRARLGVVAVPGGARLNRGEPRGDGIDECGAEHDATVGVEEETGRWTISSGKLANETEPESGDSSVGEAGDDGVIETAGARADTERSAEPPDNETTAGN
jgi:hypothetical protein